LLVAYAVSAINIRRALLLLFMWTVFVELAQPWFTQLRSRQVSDLIGNCVGLLLVFVGAEVIGKVRARR
jgi:glycopeptide antibiotics resistance protein